MKRSVLVIVIVILILIVIFVSRRSSPPSTANSNSAVQSAPNSDIKVTEIPSAAPSSLTAPNQSSTPLLGDTILRDYANTNLPPQNDLTLMSHLMDNSRLLLKSAADRPLSANEDWADFLRGKNSARERFLPDNHIALNTKGQLVDRWGTPLFFHALGGGRFDIRSAGPDRKLWTEDDIHRNSNGAFRHGTDLNPPGLY